MLVNALSLGNACILIALYDEFISILVNLLALDIVSKQTIYYNSKR